jgi:hypothetical protein
MNGATEQTLAELLATAQAMNVNLIKLNGLINKMNTSSGRGSSGGSSSSSSGSNPLSSAASVASTALSAMGSAIGTVGGLIGKVLGGAVSLVSGALGILGNIIGRTIGVVVDLGKAFVEFTKKAMDGTARLSDLFNAFSSLPFGIGTIAGLFGQLISISEKLLDTYRELTKVGASFGGNLYEMQRTAARAHLSLGEFARVVSSNSEVFATMGGNVQEGINRFTNSMNKLMDVNGPFAKKLLAMGYTAEEAANATMVYMRNQGTMNKRGLEDANLVSQGVVEYAQQLDLLSKLTGKSREKLQQEMDEVQMEETWKTFLAGLDPEEAKKIAATVAQQTALGGKEAGNSLKLAYQGINVPLTDAQKAIEVQTNGMLSRSNEQIVAAVKAGMSLEQAIRLVTVNASNMGKQVVENQKQMGTGLTGYLQATGNAQVTATAQFAATGKNLKDVDKAVDQALADRRKQEAGNATTLATAEQTIKQFGNTITVIISSFLGPITDRLASFGVAIDSTIERFVGSQGFKDTIDKVIVWFITTFNELSNAKSFEEIMDILADKASSVLSSLWDFLVPIWNNKVVPAAERMWARLEPKVLAFFDKVWNRIKDYFVGPEVKNESQESRYLEQDENNKNVMNRRERASTFAAEGVEGFLGLFNKEYAKRLAANRILSDTEAGVKSGRLPAAALQQLKDQLTGLDDPTKEVSPQQRRASGGLVNPGSYLVGEQGPEIANVGMSGDVISNDNLTALLRNSNNNNVVAALERLNNTQLQLLSAMHLNNNITDKQVRATVALGNDLFA